MPIENDANKRPNRVGGSQKRQRDEWNEKGAKPTEREVIYWRVANEPLLHCPIWGDKNNIRFWQMLFPDWAVSQERHSVNLTDTRLLSSAT